MYVEEIKRLIEQGLPGARARVAGDGTHFEAVIVCAAFEGKSTLERHRLVYQALGARMGSEIHALSMRTITPEEQATGNI
jgi:Predicted transcriptional regulator, BolA superfamily